MISSTANKQVKNVATVFVLTANGIKIALKTKPQIIKILWRNLSAKKPNTGCIIDDIKCPKAIIALIEAKFIPNLFVIKGYKGTNNEAYKSILKCPRLSPIIALFSDLNKLNIFFIVNALCVLYWLIRLQFHICQRIQLFLYL